MSDYTLHHGEALSVLATLPDDSVDAVVVDPPYSSGGFTRSDRNLEPSKKYVGSDVLMVRASFSGDNRDTRSWSYWSVLWLSECLRIVKESGYILMFTDWRQLPTATDAIQAGGFVWRGMISWDKGRGARLVNTGMFRHQCEYILYGTKGSSLPAKHKRGYDGSISATVYQDDKHHLTGKPTELMRYLIQVVPPDAVILDPFMGSGTTGVACIKEGRKFIGIEQDAYYFNVAEERIQRTEGRIVSSYPLFSEVQ